MFSVFKELLYLFTTFLLLFGLKSLALPKTTIKGSVIMLGIIFTKFDIFPKVNEVGKCVS